MDEADAEVHVQFSSVDPDRDGFVTWTEFGSRYLEGQDLQEDEILNILHKNLSLIPDPNVHKVLSEMWESWRNADENPTDGRLTEEEFSTFLHPEHSRATLLNLAKSILQNLDKDGDGKLNEAEFSRPTSEDYSPKEQEERAQEFRLVIDSNKDGHASASEMEEFMDPLNEHTALKEARHMIAIVDRDHDGFLERSELFDAGEYFTGSKFMDFITHHEDL
uniref:45 kDa calcium-binding protein-like n=1 Tax=Myxine glutinosa TaxID=7769 RepID=UPI00358EC46B